MGTSSCSTAVAASSRARPMAASRSTALDAIGPPGTTGETAGGSGAAVGSDHDVGIEPGHDDRSHSPRAAARLMYGVWADTVLNIAKPPAMVIKPRAIAGKADKEERNQRWNIHWTAGTSPSSTTSSGCPGAPTTPPRPSRWP